MNVIKIMFIFKIMRILYLKFVYDYYCFKIFGYNIKKVLSLLIYFFNVVLGGISSIN